MFQSKPSSSNNSAKASSTATKVAGIQKTGREGALQIKRLQEQALRDLPPRKLHIVLWIRNDPPSANDFHWGFYYHKTEDGGTKYHMKNLGSGWIADHGPTGGVFKSQFLCVLVEIGTISADNEGQLDQIMRSLDSSANTTPGFTCRVWIFTLLPLLIQLDLLRCSDLAALEQECFSFGNECMISASKNNQPRPVRVSRRCQ